MNKQTIPEKQIKGLTFFPIPEVDSIESAFGCEEESYFNRRDLPEVPSKYKAIVSSLFFNGGKMPNLQKQVDQKQAYRFLNAHLSSFAPAHESKMATVAYALWVWSEGDLKS